MASIDKLTIEVEASLKVPNETVKRCMALLEMWLTDNPDWSIVGERVEDRVILRMERIHDS